MTKNDAKGNQKEANGPKMATKIHPKSMKNRGCVAVAFLDRFLGCQGGVASSKSGPTLATPWLPLTPLWYRLAPFYSSTLRACPPTHLHAPYLYVPCILAPCPASAMRMLTPWVGGTKGPKGGAPGGQGAARGRTRAARAHGRTRALRALGPFGPLGPLGTAYTQQKRCQTE